MKSKIYTEEVVKNKDHAFGEASQYFPAKIKLADGKIKYALFTQNQIEVALARAVTNEEDFPKKTLLESIFEG